MYKHKKIYITGATGFIGANLCRSLLKTGARIYIMTRKTSNKRRINDILPDLIELSGDLCDRDGLKKVIRRVKPDIVLHTASYGGHYFQKISARIIETNFLGTVNLLDCCRMEGFEVFINTGSSSEYGIKSGAMKENEIAEPVDEYGVSKTAATLYCQALARAQGLAITTLRLFSPYGYYDDPERLIPSVILSCMQGRSPRVSSSAPVRDFVFIEDVLEAYRRSIENPKKSKGEVFNIGSGIQHSIGETVKTIIDLSGRKLKAEWGAASLHREEPASWRADISKAKDGLKWSPTHSLDDGLRKTIDWFHTHAELYKSKPATKK